MNEVKLGLNYLFQVIKADKEACLIKYGNVTVPLDNNSDTRHIKVGDQVEAYIYMNQQKQLVGTTVPPKIEWDKAALVDIVEVKQGLGVFVDVGWPKDILVSKDDLPVIKDHWPQIGDKLFCTMKPGNNQILAKLVGRFKMQGLFPMENTLQVGDKANAFVFYLDEEGIVLFTEEAHEIFVYYKHLRKDYRLGEAVEVIITVKKDDTHYNGSLIEQKELMLTPDAETILAYLKASGGTMNFTDKSTPEMIQQTFKMSKAAFKRALGTLYKEGRVNLEETQTVLTEKD